MVKIQFNVTNVFRRNMMALYPMLLKYKLVERLYPAAVAGLGYECYASDLGLVLKVKCFY